ncbi:coiled-coil domain-containing protein 81-like isoform X2 [Coturnix japonica]|uniref:coiled-coil domain-containing protein 81-like isoform X2 n=1 Tax=Coturnix japonica TaxID=93934 RepID=UPI0013A5C85B|nr:coiled-coil domain-containing protein 81-like isoform X2 [Coturnix japonica]
MANSLFSRPRSPPTTEKLRESELARIWSSASYYLGEQLALYQAVSIPGLGTFTVVRELVASQQNNTVAVHRPVFLLAKALAQDNDLQYDFIDDAEPDPYYELPYDEIASENGISEYEAQLCVERTLCLFSACIGKRQNVAFVWRDVGMLLIEGRWVQMKFYEDFLGKLNGTADNLQALLGMPEMSKSVISRNACAASQTSSGRVIVFPMYTHESILQRTETAKVDLKYHLKTRHEQGWSRAGDRGRKGDLCETHLLHRAALSPEKLPALTVMPGRDRKAKEKEPRTGHLPAILTRSSEKEEQKKVLPLVTPRMVDFVAVEVKKRKESSSPKEEHFSSPSESESEQSCSSSGSGSSSSSSPSLMERMMGEQEEAEEQPPSIFWDSSAIPKARLSPRTDETLQEVVQCIMRQVSREQQGQRDAERDLQDRLQSELAVVRWSRRPIKESSILHLAGTGLKPAPPPGPRPGKSVRARRVVSVHNNEDHERSASTLRLPSETSSQCHPTAQQGPPFTFGDVNGDTVKSKSPFPIPPFPYTQ